MTLRLLPGLLGALLLVACKETPPAVKPAPAVGANPAQTPTGPSQPGKAQPATAQPVSAMPPLTAPPPPPALNRDVVDVWLLAWLRAQSSGDDSRYASMYAKEFKGILREGGRTLHLDREAWLVEQKRRRGPKATIEAHRLHISTGAATAVLTFDQTFAGAVRETSARQLVLVHRPGGLQVVVEAELPVAVPAPTNVLTIEQFAFVVRQGSEAYVVLHRRVPELWATGPAVLLSAESAAAARWQADDRLLPMEVGGWRGREVVLHARDGQTCAARIADLHVLARVGPHFGTVQQWQGHEGQPRPADAEIAKEIGELAGDTKMLVGRLEGARGCHDATWARGARAAASPAWIAAGEVPADVRDKALAALRALPGYLALQKAWAGETKAPRPRWWDEHDGAKAAVVAMRDGDGSVRFVAAKAVAGDGCASFRGEFWAIWQVGKAAEGQGAGALTLLTDPGDPGPPFLPTAAIDLDGDGRMELLDAEQLVRPLGTGYKRTESVIPLSFDCPC